MIADEVFKDRDLLVALCTPRDCVRWINTRFAHADIHYGHGTDNAWDEAVALVLGTLRIPIDYLESALDAALTESEKKRILGLTARRIQDRIPVPYLVGQAWFAGLPFHVDKRVLIPRSPIAELIKERFQPWLGNRPLRRILDLCTGSGCIGIACAHAFPRTQVDMVDCSEEALEVAGRNIRAHNLGYRVRIIKSDLFAALDGQVYDLIIANPPYVGKQDLAKLPREYHYEPVLALASEDQGMAIADRILASVSGHLHETGLLVVELGYNADRFEERHAEKPFVWPELAYDGSGVLLLEARELHGASEPEGRQQSLSLNRS